MGGLWIDVEAAEVAKLYRVLFIYLYGIYLLQYIPVSDIYIAHISIAIRIQYYTWTTGIFNT